MAKSTRYSAEDIQLLEGLDPVRKRPGMYIGSTDSRGLQHCAWEIIDNAVDEALAGYCKSITVTLHSDRSVEVVDDGRGIPVDVNRKSGLTGVELVFTKLHAGGKFDGSAYAVSGGLHGVGASVVNALSSRLDVTVTREGATHTMSFQRGLPGVFDAAGEFKKRTGLTTTPVKGTKAAKSATGTRVRYWADREIFLADADIDLSLISDRARQTTFLVPGLTITVIDDRTGDALTEVFHSVGGTRDFVEFLIPSTEVLIAPIITIKGEGTFTETVPVLHAGALVSEDVDRPIAVDIALGWSNGYDANIRSFVNIISTGKGGTHVVGLERAITRALVDAALDVKALKAADENPTKEDVLEGLTAVVCVRLSEPQFEGQTKEILGTSAATKIVADIVAESLRNHFAARANKASGRIIIDKVVQASRVRRDLKEKRATARRKNAIESSALPAKLADCRSDDLEKSELLCVEGDSAMGSAKAARDSEFQALLPIRGKILNTLRAPEKKMLENAECAAIISALGGGSGRSFDLESVRYGKFITMSVTGDSPVLIEQDGLLQWHPVGPLIDQWLANGVTAPHARVASLHQEEKKATSAPLRKVIRHQYAGRLRTVTTTLGRSVAVTAGHSLFTYHDGTITLRPADTLSVGDLLVAPRILPRPPHFVTKVDLPASGDSPATTVPLTPTLAAMLGWYGSSAPDDQEPLELFSVASELYEILESATPPPPRRGDDDRHTVALQLFTRLISHLCPTSSRDLSSLVLNLSPSHQLSFLRGYYQAHGTYTENSLVFPTTSKDQATGLAFVLAQLGVVATTNSHDVTVAGADNLGLLEAVWHGSPAQDAFSTQKSTPLSPGALITVSPTLVALPIVAISDTEVDKEVYDFSVEEHESFVAGYGGGLMAHNTDADVDGAHIRCLLLTLCYRYMRPLLEAGRVYVAVAPLHRITVSGSGEFIYTFSEEEYKNAVSDLEKAGKKVKETQRYKGLGEMDAEQLAETTLDPSKRTLRRVTMDDAQAADHMFQVLMGDDVEPRREYIADNALSIDRARIDV
jgi:DNA gyrase subunit B